MRRINNGNAGSLHEIRWWKFYRSASEGLKESSSRGTTKSCIAVLTREQKERKKKFFLRALEKTTDFYGKCLGLEGSAHAPRALSLSPLLFIFGGESTAKRQSLNRIPTTLWLRNWHKTLTGVYDIDIHTVVNEKERECRSSGVREKKLRASPIIAGRIDINGSKTFFLSSQRVLNLTARLLAATESHWKAICERSLLFGKAENGSIRHAIRR